MENSIEEDIKIVEKLINTMKSDRELFNEKTDKEIYTFFINALEHILSDYKRVLKENERYKKSDYETICLENNELREITDRIQSEYNDLLKDNFKLKNDYENLSNSVVVKNHYIKNSIPIQKVKDLIEELKENGYWNYLEERDLETTIEILKKIIRK